MIELSIANQDITMTPWELASLVVLALLVGAAIGVLALALVAGTRGDDR